MLIFKDWASKQDQQAAKGEKVSKQEMLIFKDWASKQDQQAAKGEKVGGKGEQASRKFWYLRIEQASRISKQQKIWVCNLMQSTKLKTKIGVI